MIKGGGWYSPKRNVRLRDGFETGFPDALAHANPRAVISNRTNLALRLACDTNLPPMQNQPHRKSRPIRGRQNLLHVDFDFLRLRVLRESQPIRQPAHMRIHDEGRLAEDMPENHIRRLAADAGNFHERVHLSGNLAAVVLDYLARRAHQRTRLLPKESRLDD